jgi:flagellar basal body-associated protein FliL
VRGINSEKQAMAENGESRKARIIVILFLLALVSAAVLILVWATTDPPLV